MRRSAPSLLLGLLMDAAWNVVVVSTGRPENVGHAVAFGPFDFEIADDGDGHAGDVESAHEFG